MIFIIIGLLMAVLGVAGFASLVSWVFENHHIFDIIAWLIEIPLFVVLGCVAVVILVIVYWLVSDFLQWSIKKIKKKKSKATIAKVLVMVRLEKLANR